MKQIGWGGELEFFSSSRKYILSFCHCRGLRFREESLTEKNEQVPKERKKRERKTERKKSLPGALP